MASTFYIVHRVNGDDGRNAPGLNLAIVKASSPNEAMERVRVHTPPDCSYHPDHYTATPISHFCNGLRFVRGDIKGSADGAPHIPFGDTVDTVETLTAELEDLKRKLATATADLERERAATVAASAEAQASGAANAKVASEVEAAKAQASRLESELVRERGAILPPVAA